MPTGGHTQHVLLVLVVVRLVEQLLLLGCLLLWLSLPRHGVPQKLLRRYLLKSLQIAPTGVNWLGGSKLVVRHLIQGLVLRLLLHLRLLLLLVGLLGEWLLFEGATCLAGLLLLLLEKLLLL